MTNNEKNLLAGKKICNENLQASILPLGTSSIFFSLDLKEYPVDFLRLMNLQI